MKSKIKFFIRIIFYIILTIISAVIFTKMLIVPDYNAVNDYLSYLSYLTIGNAKRIVSRNYIDIIIGWAVVVYGIAFLVYIIYFLICSIIEVIEYEKNTEKKIVFNDKLNKFIPMMGILILGVSVVKLNNLTYNNKICNSIIFKTNEPDKTIEITADSIDNIINTDDVIIYLKSGDITEQEMFLSYIINNISKEVTEPVYIFNAIYDNNNQLKLFMNKYNIDALPAVIIKKNSQVEKILYGNDANSLIWLFV